MNQPWPISAVSISVAPEIRIIRTDCHPSMTRKPDISRVLIPSTILRPDFGRLSSTMSKAIWPSRRMAR